VRWGIRCPKIAQELRVGTATVDRMLRHPKRVDPGLADRLLQQLRLQRALALATIARRMLDPAAFRVAK